MLVVHGHTGPWLENADENGGPAALFERSQAPDLSLHFEGAYRSAPFLMGPMMNPAAVLFDNDGVLVDSEAIHVKIEIALLEELGLNYEYASYISRFVGLGHREYLEALSADHRAAGLGTFPAHFEQTLEARAWPRLMSDLESLPGLDALLDATAHLPRAVASSALKHKLLAKLERVGLTEHFAPHIYSAEQVARSKPAPDLFLFAAAQLNVAPNRCLVIEDSVNGIRAAQAAGMVAVGYTGGGHADADLAARLTLAGAVETFADHKVLAHWLQADLPAL